MKKKAKPFKITKADFEAAIARGKVMELTVQHARSANFDRGSQKIIVELTNDCTFTFFPRMLQGMAEATDDQLAEVEVLGSGYGLHWESLDADFTVHGLLNGVFGTAKWLAQQADKTGSRSKTEKPIPTLAEFGADILRRRQAYKAEKGSEPDLPRNDGERRTESKKALLKAIADVGGKW